MKKHKAVKDPFHNDEPQVSNVYQYEEPPELRSHDEPQGGLNVKPVEITDPNHRAKFVPNEEQEYDFSKKGRK